MEHNYSITLKIHFNIVVTVLFYMNGRIPSSRGGKDEAILLFYCIKLFLWLYNETGVFLSVQEGGGPTVMRGCIEVPTY